ncbi:MAG: hypothetical protein B7Y43_15945 [Sphingomonas sp. 28-62-20]|uniref:heme-binding protein n=1 Tax=Sphingomonas sp. 28-62-20 TaxID=1970433 RepID=UPI000BC4B55F|nr:MAG: hypothetical protein B7Y43_15945 [Sphingomonas sp. 28-62-20]
MRARFATSLIASTALIIGSCSGGGGSSTAVLPPTPSPSASPTPSTFYAVPAAEALSIADVQTVIARAAAEARARNLPAVIAVSDRVGNILAVFRMTGARATALTSPAGNGDSKDAQNLTVPAEGGAIAKAVTGAYLSSGGNAFSTRTASQIVQEHFPPAPGAVGLESGPLFGVQFSSLPCSDLVARFGTPGTSALIGPKRSPLGLSADPGGFPLYKNGVVVGAIGVMADGVYGFDANITDIDNDPEEAIALAGTVGFEAPETIRANRISVDGTQLRYTDIDYPALMTASQTPSFAATAPALGNLVSVIGYFGVPTPAIIAGTAYGTEASGIRAATPAEFANRDAFILTNGSGTSRFPVRAGTDAADVGQALTLAESNAILEEAFRIMTRARAQIRMPLDSRAQVTISLVDSRGQILGVVRGPDAPVFGTDVSLQKARTVAFFSHPRAGTELSADPSADVRQYAPAFLSFLGNQNALSGQIAYGDRTIGVLARPYFPDGEVGRPKGPLSRDIAQFNPLSTGLQSALVLTNLGQHLGFVTGALSTDTPARCTFIPDAAPGQNRLQNGLQIFPGAMPIYRGTRMIGAIGISGDGIDQDDMISFLGLHNAGVRLGGFGNAPISMRADQILIPVGNRQVRLRYVGCPFAPFLDTAEQNVCQGL